MSDNLARTLDSLFSSDSELYRSRGFMRRLGFGERPALLMIDLGNAWTQAKYPFACEGADEVVACVSELLYAARTKEIPRIFTTTAFEVPEGPHSDLGLVGLKMPGHVLEAGTEAVEIDSRLSPQDGEHVLVKKRFSAFHGTHLSSLLTSAAVDTLIVTGLTASACVRHTTEDAISDGYRPMVVRECVGDRIPGALEWNLFDIEAKFGDVVSLRETVAYLNEL